MSDETNELLRALIELTGRTAYPDPKLRKLVGKHIRAYNMCDGTHTQADIVKDLKLNKGNFSTTVKRWMEAGILFRIGGRQGRLLYACRLPAAPPKEEKGTQNR